MVFEGYEFFGTFKREAFDASEIEDFQKVRKCETFSKILRIFGVCKMEFCNREKLCFSHTTKIENIEMQCISISQKSMIFVDFEGFF